MLHRPKVWNSTDYFIILFRKFRMKKTFLLKKSELLVHIFFSGNPSDNKDFSWQKPGNPELNFIQKFGNPTSSVRGAHFMWNSLFEKNKRTWYKSENIDQTSKSMSGNIRWRGIIVARFSCFLSSYKCDKWLTTRWLTTRLVVVWSRIAGKTCTRYLGTCGGLFTEMSLWWNLEA